jgi:hypothetical protein
MLWTDCREGRYSTKLVETAPRPVALDSQYPYPQPGRYRLDDLESDGLEDIRHWAKTFEGCTDQVIEVAIYEPMEERRLYLLLGALLLLTLQFQTVPIPVGIQMMPLTSLLALMSLVFVMHRVKQSLLLICVTAFVTYAILHSLVALCLDLAYGDSALRFTSWLRQIAALIAGISVFLVLRTCLQYFSNRRILWVVIIGSIPAFVLALLNIMWGALNLAWAGVIVDGVRSVVAPLGYTNAMRASGFSSEPAMFATVIAILVLPLLFYLYLQGTKRIRTFILFFITMLIFAWTFSLVGVLLVLCLAFAGFFLGPKRTFFAKVSAYFLAAVIGALILIPSNQIMKHGRSLLLGQSNVSFIDRYYGLVGPFMMSYSSLTMFGYGLGGTSSHFHEVLPQDVQAAVASVKWKELPNLSTLVGRIFAETGAVGFTMFVFIAGVAFWECRQARRLLKDPDDWIFLASAQLGLVVTLVSVATALGSFHMPYLWFWLAVIDARFVEAAQGAEGVSA